MAIASTLVSLLLGALAATSIGLIGRWANPTVFMLALIGGLSFSVLAWRGIAQRTLDADRPPDRFGTFMQVAFFAVLVGGAWDHRSYRDWSYPDGLEAIGLAIIAAGAALRHIASVKLGDQFTIRLTVSEGHRLISTGPYRWIRHPNYAALALIAIGTSISIRSVTSTVVTLGLWLPAMLLRIHEEERALQQAIGPAYGEYCRRSWRLIPGVY